MMPRPPRFTLLPSLLALSLPLCGAPLLAQETVAEADQQRIASVLAPPPDFTRPEPFEAFPGGAGTVPARADNTAFSRPAANLPETLEFELGRALFEKLWVASPSSTRASDGLGPLYNTRACNACHIHDGRGHLPADAQDDSVSFALKLSVPAEVPARMAEIADFIGTAPHPAYGSQIQDFATAQLTAEARLTVTRQPIAVVGLSGGSSVTLIRPEVHLSNLAHGPLGDQTMLSARIAPPITGLGLIEAIPEAEILRNEDPEDSDGDGISGRANWVWSESQDKIALGRFGHKASQPSLRQQVAAALSTDMGLSTPLFPDPWGDCAVVQSACRTAPHGDGDARMQELDAQALDLLVHYTANLAVPARRNLNTPEVLRGKELFHTLGCASCHSPKHVTARLPADSPNPEHSFQLIWPYSDFLLHDMGPGLADTRPEGRATAREWRTAPLWGLGLVQQVSPEAGFLHDGRAATLLEAILWHGGEAEPAQHAVRALPETDRNALISFLESL